MQYAQNFSGSLRFRSTTSAKNEELLGVADSLNAVSENILEIFLLPVEYSLFNTPEIGLRLGGGLYYEYDELHEKGFFNMPELEPEFERVNSYTNDFSMSVFGPLLDASFNYYSPWFSVTLSAGLVPVFVLGAKQKMGIVPLLDPHYAEHSQTNAGSPYFYLSLDFPLFKYVSLALLYDVASLQYEVIDFDDNLAWFNHEQKAVSQSKQSWTSLHTCSISHS